MKKLTTGILLLGVLMGCEQPSPVLEFSVKNPLDTDRFSETVSIAREKFSALTATAGLQNMVIVDKATGDTLVTQWLDNNSDGTPDELLFQVDLKGLEIKKLMAGIAENGFRGPQSELSTFSRFVPERTDDYAWENDRVAFRTYGPDAQRRIEENLPDGTLSSGVDAWLKRVPYPIINKWYKNNDEKKGAYHIDTGEGYDPYHVGSSRGVGGTGIWIKDSLHTSGNFTEYKTIATGPVRTVFELKYATWNAADSLQVKETKHISLDLGSNFSRFESSFKSDKPLPNITIGLTLHEKEGKVNTNKEEGWFSYWEPMDGSELGVGVVIDPELVLGYKDHRVDYKDGSQLLVMADAKDKKVVYYAGFGWDKSGQFTSAGEWDAYLKDFSKRLGNPVEVSF